MLPTLGQIGPFVLFTYTVLIDLGILAGLGWLYFAAPRERSGRWVDAGLLAACGALAGARLGYVFSNWAYFGGHLGEAIRIWEGGLAWVGAAAGGALALWAYARWRVEPFWAMADALAFPLLILSALAWLGCAANACAPGREVEPGALPAWFVVDWPDNYGLTALRWPTQILGAAWALALIFGLWRLGRGRPLPAGGRALLALAGVALGGLALAFTRGDAMPQLGGLRLDALASAAVLAAALASFVIRKGSERSVKRKT